MHHLCIWEYSTKQSDKDWSISMVTTEWLQKYHKSAITNYAETMNARQSLIVFTGVDAIIKNPRVRYEMADRKERNYTSIA